MANQLRIFRVDHPHAGTPAVPGDAHRTATPPTVHTQLVRATSKYQALRHATREFKVEVAKGDDLVALTLDGIKVEDADESD